MISCTNARRSGPNENENAKNTATLGTRYEDLEFIKRVDSVCRAIDTESVSERVKDDTFVDRDGQNISPTL